jgi:hypothetical protein
MLNLLLLSIVDPARASLEVLKLQRASREFTAEEMRSLSRLLEQRVRMGETLVEYAIAIAGRPRAN